MHLDEAHALLEVEASASPEEVRRAYLRKVRHFKPEVDPEGFQRLRQAYELASAHTGPSRSSALSPRPLPRADLPLPTASLQGDLDARPDPAPPHAFVAVRAVERSPLARAVDRARARDFAEAERLTMEAFEAVRTGGSMPGLRFRDFLRVILTLQRLDAYPPAGRILARLSEGVTRDLDQRNGLGSSDLALWNLSSEIQRLPRDFPQEVRAEIVAALLDGKPELAVDSLIAVHKRDRGLARRAAERLGPNTNLRELYFLPLGGAEIAANRFLERHPTLRAVLVIGSLIWFCFSIMRLLNRVLL